MLLFKWAMLCGDRRMQDEFVCRAQIRKRWDFEFESENWDKVNII